MSAPTARGYVIHVQRPSKVGDRWHVTADDETSERTSAQVASNPTHIDSSKTTHLHVDGTVVVHELQANGRSPLQDETTVNQLWKTLDQGAKQALAPPGAHVAVGRAERKEVFGTPVPQSIGGEWRINEQLAEKSLAASGVVVSPGMVTGATKLVGVQSIDGIECLDLENRMTVGALLSVGSLPGEARRARRGEGCQGGHTLLPKD